MAQPKNKKRRQKMNGLIKQTKLDAINQIGSLAIAFCSIAALIYMFAGSVA